jgi:ABC-type antimicrobial peptide transport system permease subunit
VVRDVKYWGPAGNPPFVIYGSYLQHPWEYPGGGYSAHLWKKLVVRTATDPMSLAGAVQRIVAELDKDEVVFDVMTMEQQMAEFVAPQRFWMRLFGIFGGLAVFLAVVGIYGVMSYSVTRRTHEIGVRMAMGAERRDVLKLILGHGLKLALIGVAIGIAGSFALTRLIAGFLYDVKPTDPLTFTAVGLVLTAVALAASYLPARRATKIEPMSALRHE